MRRWSLLLLLGAALVLAVAVEVVSYDATDDRPLAVVDGVTGSVLLASAAVLRDRRRESRVGILLVIAGVAWLAGTLWSPVRFVHRGALVHVHLSYPTGRSTSPLIVRTVAAVYVIAFVEPLAANDGLTLATAAAIAFVAVAVFGRSSGTGRRAGVPALVAALALSGALALGVANRLADLRAANQVLWAYNLVIIGAVILLVVDLLRGRWAAAVVADLVVDLGRQTGIATLRGELARALGDPHLVVGYWVPSERGYVDEAGIPIDVAALQAGRVITAIDDGGEPLAVLVHDVTVLDDSSLVASVSAAARLAVVNTRLQAASRDRVEELVASRRRIVEAADDQRRRIGVELRNEVFNRLDRVDAIIGRVGAGSDGETGPLVGDLVAELREARADLDALSRGIHPLVLTEGGLPAALPSLAARSAIPVEVAVPATRFPPAIEAALYFVCAEALTNIAKHAQASRASIAIEAVGGVIRAVVADDGCGGADTARGTGLRGLLDRVEAFGGRLEIDSHEHAGTIVVATIPDA